MKLNNPIDNSDDSFILLRGNSNILIVSFASYYNKGQERYDWNILRKLNVDILFIRDLSMKWYLCGIKGVSTDVNSTVKFLETYTSRYPKVYFFGSSMGGYGALLYGSLIHHMNINIHAFGPQVDLSPENKKINPYTKKSIIKKNGLYDTISDNDRCYLALQNSVKFPDNTYVYYSKNHEYDVFNAELIKKNEIGYDTDLHAIARYLHNKNELVSLVQKIVWCL